MIRDCNIQTPKHCRNYGGRKQAVETGRRVNYMTGDLLKKQMASHSVLQGEDRLYECLVTTLTESVHVHIIYIKKCGCYDYV